MKRLVFSAVVLALCLTVGHAQQPSSRRTPSTIVNPLAMF
jgi:hypothetical protein